MDIEGWKKLFGRTQDDPELVSALAGAGVKKVPRLEKGYVDVSLNLRGHGMWLVLNDEASLRRLEDQDIGEGPLVLCGVGAYLDKSVSRDLYSGELPYDIDAGMTRDELRDKMGTPRESKDAVAPFDMWLVDDLQVIASYGKGWKLVDFSMKMPGAT